MKLNDYLKKMAASEEWLEQHASSSWPKNFFDFEPLTDVPDFRQLRKDLKSSSEDPLNEII